MVVITCPSDTVHTVLHTKANGALFLSFQCGDTAKFFPMLLMTAPVHAVVRVSDRVTSNLDVLAPIDRIFIFAQEERTGRWFRTCFPHLLLLVTLFDI